MEEKLQFFVKKTNAIYYTGFSEIDILCSLVSAVYFNNLMSSL